MAKEMAGLAWAWLEYVDNTVYNMRDDIPPIHQVISHGYKKTVSRT